MHFLHAVNNDCQTRLLNVFGQIAMFWEIKRKLALFTRLYKDARSTKQKILGNTLTFTLHTRRTLGYRP